MEHWVQTRFIITVVCRKKKSTTKETNKNSVSEIVGEPGPLRIMVYIGPIFDGRGILWYHDGSFCIL